MSYGNLMFAIQDQSDSIPLPQPLAIEEWDSKRRHCCFTAPGISVFLLSVTARGRREKAQQSKEGEKMKWAVPPAQV